MTLTIRRRPRWLATRTRLAAAGVCTTLVVSAGITGSVIGLAHADPGWGSSSLFADNGTTTPPRTTATPQSATAGQPAGTVYANRKVEGSRLFAGARDGNQFTYWSIGADGNPHLSNGSLYLPGQPAPAGGYPIVAWAHGSRGLADNCAPSVQPTDTDLDALRTWLSRGYAVVSTDYAGLGTTGTPQYFDINATAHNIVDAVRAGHDISDQLSRKWAVVGEGQGGSAAIALAQSAPGLQGATLDYRGSAATSIPAQFASLLTNLGPSTTLTVPSGWVSEALFTLSAIRTAHPDVGLDGYLTDTGRSWLTKAATMCAADLTRAADGLALGSLFSKPLAQNSALKQILDSASTPPARGFVRPVLMTQTLQDPSVVVPLTLRYINDARVADRRVEAHTYLTLDGSAAKTLADNDTRAFLTRVMR